MKGDDRRINILRSTERAAHRRLNGKQVAHLEELRLKGKDLRDAENAIGGIDHAVAA